MVFLNTCLKKVLIARQKNTAYRFHPSIYKSVSFAEIRSFSTSNAIMEKLKIAVIGQSQFAAEVYKRVVQNGHEVVGVFTIPDDKNGREDALATFAAQDGVPVFKYKAWRRKGVVLPNVLDEFKSVGATLNVMPFCSQFIPMEIINMPKHRSICYHPSLLPRHRGASAISWTLIQGDTKGGFTVFWPDDGLDTGPILLQRECDVGSNDTVDSIYKRFMYPEGINAMAEAVNQVAKETAPSIVQSEDGATYDEYLNKPELCRLHFDQPAVDMHNFIRGLDSSPGASITLNGKEAKIFGSKLWTGVLLDGATEVEVTTTDGSLVKGIIHEDGLLLTGNDGKHVIVGLLFMEGKFVKANKYGQNAEAGEELTFTDEEREVIKSVKDIWISILKIEDITDETDFFSLGAGSMDVVRLVEEIKDRAGIIMTNEDVFMATMFGDFKTAVILLGRGGPKTEFVVKDAIKMKVNKMEISFSNKLFINGDFVSSVDGTQKNLKLYNPHDESLICEVECASTADVDLAVDAAEKAFYEGEWGKMNARDRGTLLFKLADLMDQNKEELATIEAIDSGAVYTLALKTHVGMSVDVWRYMAGWCDKIQGVTIPINHSRPNRNFAVTRREPIGVCGLVTPWNYPLMMLSWKMAACLAAGNTVVIKPAQVCPLTALKFAELSVKAGIPAGVINVLPGTGRVTGQAIADHKKIRKLGFTGSTGVGHTIMESAAKSNIKKVSLELGGKSPLIIFSDFDIDRAVRTALGAAFFNKGENCIAAGRIFVEETIYEAFLRRASVETAKMIIGDPLDRGTAHGPQNHRAHLEKLVDYVKKGISEGARLVYGGKQVDRPGLYMTPTILADVEDHMFVAKEESFGPIMIVSKFASGDVSEVVRRANATEFGLAGGVLTNDFSKAMSVAERLDCGTCFVNTYNKTDVAAPFGGFKMSGFGKDMGEEALNDYLKTKTIIMEYSH